MAITDAVKRYKLEETTTDAALWKCNNNNGSSPLIQDISVKTPWLDVISNTISVTTESYGKWTQRGLEWCSLTLSLTTSILPTPGMKSVSKKTCTRRYCLLWLRVVRYHRTAKYGSLISRASRIAFNAYDRSCPRTFTLRRILQTRTSTLYSKLLILLRTSFEL